MLVCWAAKHHAKSAIAPYLPISEIILPQPLKPVGQSCPLVKSDNLIFNLGQFPLVGSTI